MKMLVIILATGLSCFSAGIAISNYDNVNKEAKALSSFYDGDYSLLGSVKLVNYPFSMENATYICRQGIMLHSETFGANVTCVDWVKLQKVGTDSQ